MCDQWITGEAEWTDHCTSHLAQPATLPVWCDPVSFRHTPACPGYCITHLFSQKSPEECLRYWEYPNKWKEHINKCLHEYCLERSSAGEAIRCSDPRCEGEYGTERQLRFHMSDSHGYPLPESEGDTAPEAVVMTPTFVNEEPGRRSEARSPGVTRSGGCVRSDPNTLASGGTVCDGSSLMPCNHGPGSALGPSDFDDRIDPRPLDERTAARGRSAQEAQLAPCTAPQETESSSCAPPQDRTAQRPKKRKRLQALDDNSAPERRGAEDEYRIDRILDERIVRRGRGLSHQYLVQWTGYAEPTWNVARLLDETEALDRWLARGHQSG
jgi:Chromo (CHRromatin Organisation MOdifier) domain